MSSELTGVTVVIELYEVAVGSRCVFTVPKKGIVGIPYYYWFGQKPNSCDATTPALLYNDNHRFG